MKRKRSTTSPLEAERDAFVITLMASPLEPSTKHILRSMAHHPDPLSLPNAKRIYDEALAKTERERGATHG